MEQTSMPEAKTERSDAEKTADALQTWGAIARAVCVLLGVVAFMLALPVAASSAWVASACLVAGAVVLIAAGFWIHLWHDGAAQLLLQLDGMRRDLVEPRRGADLRDA